MLIMLIRCGLRRSVQNPVLVTFPSTGAPQMNGNLTRYCGEASEKFMERPDLPAGPPFCNVKRR
jgi:inhibitor of KinA sporulation pathway (predicted exonuclease)